jgi:RNA polymerase sigma-70 factor (ECF subfamily)
VKNEQRAAFAEFIAVHLDAGYNLARWISGNDDDAADILQDACLRAFNGFASFRGINGRAWLLTIVRNTAYNFIRDRSGNEIPLDDGLLAELASNAENPEHRIIRENEASELREAIDQLPPEYREAIVLREMEEMSYKEIAVMQQVPVGTVMSRLSRARTLLRNRLRAKEENS